MRRFAATLDASSKLISYLVLVVLLIPFISITTEYLKHYDSKLLIGPIVVTIGLLLCYFYRPKEYGLDSQGLHIIRSINPFLIPLKNIQSIGPVTSKELGFGIKVLGSGGFLGYFGFFFYRNMGGIWVYATDQTKMLLITLKDDKRIIISPADTEQFMKGFHEIARK